MVVEWLYYLLREKVSKLFLPVTMITEALDGLRVLIRREMILL